MEVEIEFAVGADVQKGEPRLWLYATREQWPPEFRARLGEGPQDAVVLIGDRRIAARIKAHDGDGGRTYVAARQGSLRGAGWPGHRGMTEMLRAMRHGAGDRVRARVAVLVTDAEQA